MSEAGEKLTVRVPESLLVRVDRAAQNRGIGRSEFVRQALSAQTDVVLGPSDQGGPSLYDFLTADGVIGAFSAPPGLSTSPRDALHERIRARRQSNGHCPVSHT
jgi:hypothetical protein